MVILGRHTGGLDPGSECLPLGMHRCVVAFNDYQLRRIHTRIRPTTADAPVIHPSVRNGQFAGGVMRDGHGDDVLANPQVLGRQLTE